MLVFSLSPPSASCSRATSSAFDFSYRLWFSDPSFYCALFPSIQVKVSSRLCDISLWCPMFSTSWTCAGLLSRNPLHPSYLCWPFLHNFSEILFSQLICLLKLFSSACNTPFSHLTLSISSHTYSDWCSFFITWITSTFFWPSSTTSPYLL